MRIESVESHAIGGTQVVRIVTESGIVGWGQTACWAYPEAVDAVVRKFATYLVGQDPRRIEHHWNYLYRMGPFRGSVLSGAVSAVDLALWDIKGKHFGVPVWELLGGKSRDKVRLYLLMDGDTPESAAANAREAVDDGFTAIKFDPIPDGFGDMTLHALVAGVEANVEAARDAVGGRADIILELHRKLTPLQAIPVAEAVRRFQPLFIEDPIQIDSIQSQGELSKRINAPFANGERLHTIWEFRELLVAGGTQFVRPDVGLAGGLTHVKKIAAIAESFHAAVVTHNFLTPLLTAASIHHDVSIPNFVAQEYSKGDEGPMARAYPGTLKRDGGYIHAPDAPGLGVEVDLAVLPEVGRTLLNPLSNPLRNDGSVLYAV